ncbi:MAG: hypothetical protein HC817_15035, partial [Saprospiraceae bacterium]|nr:hypothetical protein [Saprospiraceae bacterium]
MPFATFVCEGDSLRIGNQWFKETGQYLITLKNTEGCDSLVALNLTVRKNTLIDIEKTTCDSAKLGVEVFRSGGSGGCDTITTVRTVFQRKNIPFAITLESPVSCDGKADGALNIFMPDAPIEEFKLKWSNGDSVDRIANLRPGLYFLTVTDNEGCKATESFDLKNPPSLNIEATGIAPKCANEPQGSIRLTAISGGTEPYRYRVSRFTDTIRALPLTIGNIDVGRYRLRIFDDNGCSSDTTVDVNAGRELALSLGSDVTIALGDTIELTPLSSIQIEKARWTPFNGGILCDTCFSTRVRPVETTTYTLTATDIIGCTDSARITILVENKLRLFVPNTFTPNV